MSRFDKYTGNGRQHDLLLIDPKNRYVISVEAKVDEPFDLTIYEQYLKSKKTLIEKPKSNQLNRLEDLSEAILDHDLNKLIDSNDELLQLRYQLLHSVAGTLSEAKKQESTKALLVFHIFKTPLLNLQKHDLNSKDLNNFIKVLSKNQFNQIQDKQIIGPFFVKGNEYIPNDIPLYIGKIES